MLHRLTVRSLLSTITLIVASTVASAQSGPPLEWVVGYPAGGGSDFVARALSEPLARGLERPIVVSNKPGAATSVAAGYVAKSREQGNVIFSADFATLAANPYLYSKLPYDAEKDFTPVGLIARFPMLLVVHPSVPAKDLREFAAWAKTQPDGVHYASAGPGSPHHLATEYLRQRTGLKLVHVAYRGAAPAVNDLLGGQVRMAIMDTATIQQYITSGKVRALGVASKQRLAAFPDLPTLAEQGLTDFEVYAWQGLVVPNGTPAEFVERLNKNLVAALRSPNIQERFKAFGLEPLPGTAREMSDYAASERKRWSSLIRAAGITLD